MIEPTGYTALDLIGFTDKGGYDPDAYYVKNDIATVGNTKWRCLIDDTHNVTPTEGANWTIYLESATSLAGMSDVTLTSPKNGDGLVHDGNEWTNVPIVTQAQNDILGSKNVAVGAFHNGTENGITWTVDSDNVVTITSSTGSVGPANITSDEFILPKGTWILSKNPIQIPNIRIALLVSGSAVAITYDEEIAYYASSDTKCRIRLYVPSTTGALNVKFYPMIRPSIVKDNSYAPPAKTNRQLTNLPNNLGASVDLTGYTSENNMYEFPSDGYVRYAIKGNQTGSVVVYGNNGDTTGSAYLMFGTSSAINATTTTVLRGSVYVRKGMKAYCSGTLGSADFIPLK